MYIDSPDQEAPLRKSKIPLFDANSTEYFSGEQPLRKDKIPLPEARSRGSLSDVLTGKYESLFDFTDDSEDKDAIMEDARIASKGAPSYFKVLLDDIEKHQKSKLPFSHSNRFGFGVKQGADGQFEQKDMVTGYGTEPLHHLEIYEPPGKKGPFTQSQLNSGELLFPSDEEESEDSTRMRHDYEGRTFYGKQPRTVDDLLHEHGHQRSFLKDPQESINRRSIPLPMIHPSGIPSLYSDLEEARNIENDENAARREFGKRPRLGHIGINSGLWEENFQDTVENYANLHPGHMLRGKGFIKSIIEDDYPQFDDDGEQVNESLRDILIGQGRFANRPELFNTFNSHFGT